VVPSTFTCIHRSKRERKAQHEYHRSTFNPAVVPWVLCDPSPL
jgi:hypothetical protein